MRVHMYACMCMCMGVKNSKAILQFPVPKENILTFFYKKLYYKKNLQINKKVTHPNQPDIKTLQLNEFIYG